MFTQSRSYFIYSSHGIKDIAFSLNIVKNSLIHLQISEKRVYHTEKYHYSSCRTLDIDINEAGLYT